MHNTFSLTILLISSGGFLQELFAHQIYDKLHIGENTSPPNNNILIQQNRIPSDSIITDNSYEKPSRNQFGPDNTEVSLVVETFANNFIAAIKASERLLNAFKISRFSPEEASNIYYEVVHSAGVSSGSRNPEFLAQMVAEAVQLNYDLVTDSTSLNTYGYGMGNYLQFMKALTQENVFDMSQRYFEFIRNGIISEAGTREGDMKGLSKGFIGFADSLGLATRNAIPLLAVHFADEWYRLRS